MTILTLEPKTKITERVGPHDPRAGLVSADPTRHSGTPCFAGTRVPVQDLFDYLADGESLDSFLTSFPSVRANRQEAFCILQKPGSWKVLLVRKVLRDRKTPFVCGHSLKRAFGRQARSSGF